MDKRSALITGSSRGIGKAIALKLASAGCNTVINYLPDKDEKNLKDALGVVEEISSRGGESIVCGADVSVEEEAGRMVREAVNHFGKVDVLVNNAGILRDKTLKKMQRSEWDSVINVNLGSVYNCCRAVVNHMLERRFGRIINISSVVAFSGNYGQTNYCASKSGIVGFTKSLALELAAANITVNAIAPGIIETDMIMSVPEKYRLKLIEKIPAGRIGSVEDIANAAGFLSGDEACYITGQVIHVNGGYYL